MRRARTISTRILAALVVLGQLASGCSSEPERLSERGIELVKALDDAEDRAWESSGVEKPFATAVVKALASDEPVVRAHAARAIGRVRTWETISPLFDRFDVETDPDVRRALVEAMIWRRPTIDVSRLHRLAREGPPDLRTLAIHSLTRTAWKGGDGRSVEEALIVIDALRDENAEVRLAGALVLAARPALRVPLTVLAQLFDAREDERVRWVAMQALAARPELAQERSDLCVTAVLDVNFLVGFHATRALELFDEIRGLEEACALLSNGDRPWRGRLGAARLLESWLRRKGEGRFRVLDEGQRAIVQRCVVATADRLLVDGVDVDRTPVLLVRAIHEALLSAGTDLAAGRASQIEERFEAALGARPLTPREVSGQGPNSIARLRPVLDPAPRGPRVLVHSDGLFEIVLELFVEEAPVHVGRLLEMIRRGHLDPAHIDLSADPIAVIVEPGARDPDFENLPRRREPSSRRILAGTIVYQPGKAGPGRYLIALRPLPELEGSVVIVGRVLTGQQELPFLHPGRRTRFELP